VADRKESGTAGADHTVPSQLVLTVIAAAGAGIGSLGFVTAVGALVTLARLYGAGLPTEVSVSLQSRGLLLTVGGEVLAVAMLVALALVAAVHWSPVFDMRIAPKWLRRRVNANDLPWSWLLTDAEGIRLRWRCFGGVLVIATLVDYYAWAGHELNSGRQQLLLAGVAVVALAGSAAATKFAMSARSRSSIDKPGGEAARLLGLFGVVALLGAVAAAAGNVADPRVRPAAVLLLDHPPRVLCGIYVGQTSDRLYIGEAVQADSKHDRDSGKHDQGQLIEINRKHVGGLVIGTAQSLHDALSPRPPPESRIQALNGDHRPGEVDVNPPSVGCVPRQGG
jgi:hypothetical protein